FYFPTPEHRIWRPLVLDPASDQYQNNGWLVLFGRVKAGLGPARVADDLRNIARALGERFDYPAAWDKTQDPSSRSARDYLVGNVRPALLLLLGAGAMLLLMACANVAALILARTTDRGQEIALRAAIGAGRGRLVRQIVAESLTFSILAGAVGGGVAFLGFGLLVSRLPLAGDLASEVTLDWTALAAAFALAALVGLAVALAPVREILRGRLRGISGVRGAAAAAHGAGQVHRGLVGVEAAVAAALVVGALLLVRTVSSLLAVDLGFDPDQVVTVDVASVDRDIDDGSRVTAYDAILERAQALPGVTAAAWNNRLLVRDGGWQGIVGVVGRPELDGANAPNALFRAVSPGYFDSFRIRIVAGRGFTAADRPGTPLVALVSRAFAERAWPGEDPIGRRVVPRVIGRDTAMVVGVVADVRSTSITGANEPVLYIPIAQRPGIDFRILSLRSAAPPATLIAAVRRIVGETDPRLAVTRPGTMNDVVRQALAEPMQLRFFLGLFAALALVLGMVGIYSVASYSVARRQTELGLRMALGAAPGQVLRQVIVEGITPVLAGTVVGLGAALVLARGASRFLYQVSPFDPVSAGGAALALLFAGTAAALMPAFRASRVSPIESLRAE
ncbi:MAG: FtsX-like permease family protein, partial [Gemmatimonadales bacterium]